MSMRLHDLLLNILKNETLQAVFQPIMDLKAGQLIGYEGLIRGPSDGPLHAPIKLLSTAEQFGLTGRIESLCVVTVMDKFIKRGLPGRLFLNISPLGLLEGCLATDKVQALLNREDFPRDRVVFEITESSPKMALAPVVEAVMALRAQGFRIALDDLGEGFSSLRLWSELQPDYVKIDKHFVHGIHQDPTKLQFIRSIQQIAENGGARLIAEGIENRAEFQVIKDMGICYGQGYFIGHPLDRPAHLPSHEVLECMASAQICVYPHTQKIDARKHQSRKLLMDAPSVPPNAMSEEVLKVFQTHPKLHALPVVRDGVPVGLINRSLLIDRFSRVYTRELYGKKPCAMFMDSDPLIVDIKTPVAELSQLVVNKGKSNFADGYIFTDQGRYLGVGSSFDLMQEITDLQIQAARYANPLTLLPGNVPITEHTERLLENQQTFCACYADLDHFKPFNDVYGYRKGDEVIQMTANLLSIHCDPDMDFVGHIGGDDFFILFQSTDWEQRCGRMLEAFDRNLAQMLPSKILADGGYEAEDRRGNMEFHPFPALSIGVVQVTPGRFAGHYEVASAATEVKKMAKRTLGSSIYIDKRSSAQERVHPRVAA
jgi:EAL domain-containing protein (putative c-di-GMP-specific phosphodiesterase class I)/GGDEF domain-containing protein/CBS domain-containing protein